MSALKNIQDLYIARVLAGEPRAGMAARRCSSGGIDFDRILTASLKQLYSDDLKPKEAAAVMETPVFDPLKGLELDDEAKFREGLRIVLKHEGSGLVREDGGNESSKYGILQSTAKAYGYKGNVKNLTRADAEGIYRKIWEKSGAGSMPHPLSAVHFDTYVNSPSMAKKLLSQSKGSTDTYLKLRLQRYSRIAHLRPERYGKYLNGWVNRVKSLQEIASNYSPAYASSGRSKSFRS